MEITEYFSGKFITSPEAILEKLHSIKAFVFDWDGVFNSGQKDAEGNSPFNEVDAMGTNLLRFNHYLRNGEPPVTAIITGEKNKAALKFANREHLAAVYCGIKFKADALKDLCQKHHLAPNEVCFMFDDILDFSAAEICGLRIMVNRTQNPLMVKYAIENNLVDYLTENDGSRNAIREMVEMLTGLSGRYNETMRERAHFTEIYQEYIAQRNEQYTQLYTVENKQIIPIESL